MLVNYYIIERDVAKTSEWNLLSDALGAEHVDASGINIPRSTCIYFSANTVKYVFCLDSAINVPDICTSFNFQCQLVQSSTIDDSTYNREYLVGIDENKQYILFKLFVPPPLPEGFTGQNPNLPNPDATSS